MRKLAVAGGIALIIPVVQTVVAPQAYAAGSTVTQSQCQSGNAAYLNKCCDYNRKRCTKIFSFQVCLGSGC